MSENKRLINEYLAACAAADRAESAEYAKVWKRLREECARLSNLAESLAPGSSYALEMGEEQIYQRVLAAIDWPDESLGAEGDPLGAEIVALARWFKTACDDGDWEYNAKLVALYDEYDAKVEAPGLAALMLYG